MEIQIKMVSAAADVFNFKKMNPNAIHEEVFQHVSNNIEKHNINQKIKLAMIAAAGRAFELSDIHKDLTEKELLKKFVDEIPMILERINEE